VGETNEEAALREMGEELGVDHVTIDCIVEAHIYEGYCVSIYKTFINSTSVIEFDTHEISEVFWISPETLTEQMNHSPELFTRNFRDVWQKHCDKIISS
jgi:8-oxo-dGTP pyrophosphatase MutT (NUDIX family)